MAEMRWLCLLALSSTVRADEFTEHYGKATRLEGEERYDEAQAELEAAYRIRQAPRILYDFGVVHQRLGDARGAIDYYRRFLAADPTVDTSFRISLEREIEDLESVAAPPAKLRPVDFEEAEHALAKPPDRRRGSPALMFGGAALWGAAYLCAFVSGIAFAVSTQGAQQNAAGTLLIPGVGPFVSGLVYRDAGWSLPWVLVDGLAQAAGVLMLGTGATVKMGPREGLTLGPASVAVHF
jgi:tetratricopeptide (TPR) repeat protein